MNNTEFLAQWMHLEVKTSELKLLKLKLKQHNISIVASDMFIILIPFGLVLTAILFVRDSIMYGLLGNLYIKIEERIKLLESRLPDINS